MSNQHPGLSFLAMPPTAMSIGTHVQCRHGTSAQLGAGQANTYYPPYSGELHSFLPTPSVRRRSSVSCPLINSHIQDTHS